MVDMYQELVSSSNEFIDDVIKRKYTYGNEKSYDDIVNRFDNFLKRKRFKYRTKFIELFREKKILPAGSVIAGFGTDLKSSFSNCYFIPIKCDSIECIFDAMKEAARTFSWRGGVGINISILRPKGANVDNSAKISTGSVSFMPLISQEVGTIGQCIQKNQRVFTKDGYKEIQYVKKGDRVWTLQGWTVVLGSVKNKKKIFKVTTRHPEGKEIFVLKASEDHVIMDDNMDERPIKDFVVGDKVITLFDFNNLDDIIDDIENTFLGVESSVIEKIKELDYDDTYDLVLEKEHLFWCEGFYVHNSGRRGASIIIEDIRHPDIIDFIKCKSNPEEVFEKDMLNNYLPAVHYANISVIITDEFMEAVENDRDWELKFPDIDSDKDFYNKNWDGDFDAWEEKGGKFKVYQKIKARKLFDLIAENAWKRAEPGVLFWGNVMRNSPQNAIEESKVRGVNPCVTADTLVAVADGRGDVPIKTLAEEGKDIPVYSMNSNGELAIKMMRHPRVTGYNQEIYEIKLDDGSSIKVTGNHEFRMKDGSYREAKDLKPGDSLDVWSKVIDVKGNYQIDNKNQRILENEFLKQNELQVDLPTFIDKGNVYVKRKCEICGNEFVVPFDEREQSYCSEKCASIGAIKKEECKLPSKNIIGDSGGLEVVSITKVGEEDVYNGTVDDTHNFCISLGKHKCKNGKEKTYYVTSLNCGEQILPNYGACSLFHVVLHSFVKEPYTQKAYFDVEGFENSIDVMMEFADFVSDVNIHPLKEQQHFEKIARKIGVGTTGLGDMLAMLNKRYDSDGGIELADKVYKIFAAKSFLKEIEMAKKYGPCKLLGDVDSKKTYANQKFIQDNLEYVRDVYGEKIYKEAKEGIINFGVRNISWTTIAPTGTVSILANNCTSGIEPLFDIKYIRNSISLNKTVELVHKPLLDYIAKNRPEDIELSAEDLKKKYHYVTADEIDYIQRVKMQGTIQKYITDSVSSTINLSSDTKVEDIKNIYMEAYKHNLKGVTVYRDGCMSGVLVKSDSKNDDDKNRTKVDIPDERESKTYTMLWKKNKIYVTIPFMNKKPIEVFVNLPPEASLDNNGRKSVPLKLERESTWNAITRLISLNLRVNTPVSEIIKQLNKASNTIGDLPNVISRALAKIELESKDDDKDKEYMKCPSCGKNKLVREGGCEKCLDCGYSKCG